jgi:hypothetical protein
VFQGFFFCPGNHSQSNKSAEMVTIW